MSGRTDSLIAHLTSLVEPIADDFVVEVVDVEFANGVLRVVIDQQDGLASGPLVEVTKAISRMLDDEDPIPGRFTLEVTSPGVERPLKRPDHFRRAIGSDVTVKATPDVPGDRRIDGVLSAADEYGITITTADGDRTLRYGEIRTARTAFEWGPAPKPGGPKKTKKESASR